MVLTSLEAFELFNSAMSRQAREQAAQRDRLCDMLQSLPTTDETLNQLCALSHQDFKIVQRCHPGYKAQRNIESLRAMIGLFHLAMTDLDAAVASFPTLGSPDSRKEREAYEEEVSLRVNKELLAAVSSSQALVDYCRRLKDQLPSDFDEKRKELFDENEHAFIKDLRNLLVHRLHAAANWQTVYSSSGHSTHFQIQSDDLLQEGELTAAAKQHLKTIGKTVNVSELLSQYARRVDQFYDWLLSEIEQHLPDSVIDLRRCRDTVKRHHGRLSYQFLLGVWIQAKVDPYEHLPKHLTAKQLAIVSSLPKHSSEQVDYIISCIDTTDICTSELRSLVYELFHVSDSGLVLSGNNL